MLFALFTQKDTENTEAKLPLLLHNTLSGEKEPFEPLNEGEVRMYTCGPTVYDYIHIGNLRSFVFADILKRALRYNGYEVKHVVNITDLGHLTSDADEGEDKMTKGLRREGMPITLEAMKELSDKYAEAFLSDFAALNALPAQANPRPSEFIGQQVALIETLIEKEYAYETSDGVYFDVGRFKGYGKLGGIDLKGQEEGARVKINPEKRGPFDFALWKKNPELGWESPWGKGFPGWHIECSAMAMALLGKQIDIHTGGADLASVHHNNEIAQSEAATGKPFARYWLHNAFLNIEGTKISKSLGNTIYLRHLTDRGYSPLVYRYWLLTAHYRSPVNFTWEALDAAKTALTRLSRFFFEELDAVEKSAVDPTYRRRFLEAINDDLDTPKAVAIMWELVKDGNVPPEAKKATLLSFDKVLGLGLRRKENGERVHMPVISLITLEELPGDVRTLVEKREALRAEKDFAGADKLRDELTNKGYSVEDSPEGPRVSKM